jgi:hypothetical protein
MLEHKGKKIEGHFKTFDDYLNWIGAEILEKTNPYEVSRFVANQIVCVIYHGKRGLTFSSQEALKVLEAYNRKQKINVAGTKRIRLEKEIKEKIRRRDGNMCFYTGVELTEETESIEHLIPVSKGGKNNLDNLVLCTKQINYEMADKPLIEKIRIRDKLLHNKEN